MDFYQGDIIRISKLPDRYLIVSKNAFIRSAGVFHVCPVLKTLKEGPAHIKIHGYHGEEGVVVCEQIKFTDPSVRSCMKTDSISYDQIMNISDVIQGIFEYD